MIHEDGTGEVWVRKGESWGKWWRRARGKEREDEVEIIDDGAKERSWWMWRNVFRPRRLNRSQTGERRPLLS